MYVPTPPPSTALAAPRSEQDVERLQMQYRNLHSTSPDGFILLSALALLAPNEIALPDQENVYGPVDGDVAFVANDDKRLLKALQALEKDNLIAHSGRTVILAEPVFTSLPTFLDPVLRRAALVAATAILSAVFPRMEAHHLQLYTAWSACNALIPHVHRLREAWKNELPQSSGEAPPAETLANPIKMCQILAEAARFLYETCNFAGVDAVCSDLLSFADHIPDCTDPDDVEEAKSDVIIGALSQRANAAEMLCDTNGAMEYNRRAYIMRREQKVLRIDLIGGFEGNIGLNNDTAGFHDEAFKWHERARETLDLEGAWGPTYMSNMARCMMYRGDLKEADDLLDSALDIFEREDNRQTSMIAFSLFVKGLIARRLGDPNMAAKIFLDAYKVWCEGLEDDALVRSQKHPFAGGCLYKAGLCLFEQGEKKIAAKFLKEALEVSKPFADSMPADVARATLMLARAIGEEDALWHEVAADEGKPSANYRSESEYDVAVPLFWR